MTAKPLFLPISAVPEFSPLGMPLPFQPRPGNSNSREKGEKGRGEPQAALSGGWDQRPGLSSGASRLPSSGRDQRGGQDWLVPLLDGNAHSSLPILVTLPPRLQSDRIPVNQGLGLVRLCASWPGLWFLLVQLWLECVGGF